MSTSLSSLLSSQNAAAYLAASVRSAALISLIAVGAANCQVFNQHAEPGRSSDIPQTEQAKEIRGAVKVTVQADKPRTFLAPRALGVFVSAGDNQLADPMMPQILQASGVTTLRYPGGSYADTYHWSAHKSVKFQGTDQAPYVAAQNDFGHFVRLIDQVGTAVITVNYGSNFDGTGGGTPEEAAAWVAYAMGDPTNPKAIGKDTSGHDWQTVGYWASLRASQPLAADDGLNFLRIGHPNPVLIKYWEVGNEVYKNGYYNGQGAEEDLHAPYSKDPRENEKRRRNQALSPDAYGNNLLQFVKAMKAVDGRIKVGASLDVPLAGDWNLSGDWVEDPMHPGKYVQKGTAEAAGLGVAQKNFDAGLDWDKNVLKIAGKEIDFVALHWYTAATTQASNWKDIDNTGTLMKPQDELPKIMAGLLDLFQKYCGQNMQNMQLLVTEFGITPWIKVSDDNVLAMFAADSYVNLVEDGAANIDFAELHKNGFLNEENKPGPVYFAVQLVRQMANLNDKLVTAASSNSLLSVHASLRSDGKVGIMLINKDPKNNASVKVSVSGVKLTSSGNRFDYGRSNPAKDYSVQPVATSDLGNNFTVTVPSYTITDLVIPIAQ